MVPNCMTNRYMARFLYRYYDRNLAEFKFLLQLNFVVQFIFREMQEHAKDDFKSHDNSFQKSSLMLRPPQWTSTSERIFESICQYK